MFDQKEVCFFIVFVVCVLITMVCACVSKFDALFEKTADECAQSIAFQFAAMTTAAIENGVQLEIKIAIDGQSKRQSNNTSADIDDMDGSRRAVLDGLLAHIVAPTRVYDPDYARRLTRSIVKALPNGTRGLRHAFIHRVVGHDVRQLFFFFSNFFFLKKNVITC